jgi:hypothetical protein
MGRSEEEEAIYQAGFAAGKQYVLDLVAPSRGGGWNKQNKPPSTTCVDSVEALLTHEPRTIGEVTAALHVSRREVEASIQELRLRGVPVMSGADGIWLGTSSREVQAGAEALRRRIVQQAITQRALRSTARRMAVEEDGGDMSFGW